MNQVICENNVMKIKNDITGCKFNRLKAIEYADIKNSTDRWLCICECGILKVIRKDYLMQGRSKSCGCLRAEFSKNKKICLIGQKFNRLLVIAEEPTKKCKDAVWKCMCDCGNHTSVRAVKLKSGTTKSCGCYSLEKLITGGIKWSQSDEGRRFLSERNSSKRGPDSPNWKGGKEEENIRLRYSVEARQWRLKIYERDGFVCTECKEKGKRLNAHHIKPWSLYPELRFDIDNGKTVCIDCHKELHRIHGNPKRKKCLR